MANRRSIFSEAAMEEFTPANSINEESFREGRRWRLLAWANGRRGKPVLRIVNAVLHVGVCTVLLAIMVEFMLWYRGQKRRPQAIALSTLVASDSCLDVYAVLNLKKKWPGWAMVLRLLLAMSYIAQFLLYVGYRKVFPASYEYWGLAESFSDAVVYILLLALGIWNLLHTAIHRHALGRDLRRLVVFIQTRQGHSSPVDHGGQSVQRQVPREGRSLTANTPSRTEQASSSHETIALGQIRTDVKDSDLVVTEQSRGTSTTGESSLHEGSTVYTKSETVSAITSRRPSTTPSGDETTNADGLVNNSTARGEI